MSGKPVLAIAIGTGGKHSPFRQDTIEDALREQGLDVKQVGLAAEPLERPWHLQEFDRASGPIVEARCAEGKVIVIPRHGAEHRVPPSATPWLANALELKRLGVTHYWATTAVGSLSHSAPPGSLVLLRQYADLGEITRSFFDTGPAVHLSMAEPSCQAQGSFLAEVSGELGIPLLFNGGGFVIKGPEFSTRMESVIYRFLFQQAVEPAGYEHGLIMMSMPHEAKPLRAAGVHATWLALVTDYDSWHEEEEPVTAEMVESRIQEMVDRAGQLFLAAIPRLFADPSAIECSGNCCPELSAACHTKPKFLTPEQQGLLEFLGRRD